MLSSSSSPPTWSTQSRLSYLMSATEHCVYHLRNFKPMQLFLVCVGWAGYLSRTKLLSSFSGPSTAYWPEDSFPVRKIDCTSDKASFTAGSLLCSSEMCSRTSAWNGWLAKLATPATSSSIMLTSNFKLPANHGLPLPSLKLSNLQNCSAARGGRNGRVGLLGWSFTCFRQGILSSCVFCS